MILGPTKQYKSTLHKDQPISLLFLLVLFCPFGPNSGALFSFRSDTLMLLYILFYFILFLGERRSARSTSMLK